MMPCARRQRGTQAGGLTALCSLVRLGHQIFSQIGYGRLRFHLGCSTKRWGRRRIMTVAKKTVMLPIGYNHAITIKINFANDDMKGFVLLPCRWVVERTFSWFGRNRRLAKDWENLAATLQAFVALASIQIAIRRLAR
jgi:transposase